jgi:hypothetical protein
MESRRTGQQVKGLKYESDLLVPDPGKFVIVMSETR